MIISTNDFSPASVHETYENLISKYKNSIIVLSYKKGGVPSIEFLESLVEKSQG